MTISISRALKPLAVAGSSPYSVDAADIWDVAVEESPQKDMRHVRTLDSGIRNSDSDVFGAAWNAGEIERSIELRREKRAAVFMGILLGMGLILGSALGGAFAGEDAVPAPASGMHTSVSHS